ncbi:hypothetical protein [Falsiroseomonas sp. E2-1-a20]|uniref:hypothetical protein n=1 Tax=Falsiroseomonas sp. E2-1-a20 TaxID=3239300 RepID=UPI003F2C4E9D
MESDHPHGLTFRLPATSPQTSDAAFGLGDINPTFFLSPSRPSAFTWGFGPTFSLPTATDRLLGSGKWAAGPAVVGLYQSGPWVVGALANNIWPFSGDQSQPEMNRLTVQPFINYNFDDGWYATSSPVVTADWNARGEKWTVPVGGGFGRLFRIGSQPVNAQAQAFYNAVRADEGPKWTARFQLQFLFPRYSVERGVERRLKPAWRQAARQSPCRS